MIEMAQTYVGCSKTQLALTLNRDPAKVVPESGNPKLDMVFGLSDVLEWPAGDVAEALWCDPVADVDDEMPLPDKSFSELNQESLRAHRDGDHEAVRRVCAAMLRVAATPKERGIATNRMATGFDQAGRYAKALEWTRMAASIPGIPDASRLLYLANLAGANYTMWNLNEAIGIAAGVLAEAGEVPLDDVSACAKGIAAYVSGNARRRLMSELPERRSALGRVALDHLKIAAATLKALAERRGDDSYAGIANTCVGAEVEIRVMLNEMTPLDAVKKLADGLDAVVDPSAHPRGDGLESWGWWAVFGLNISVRELSGDERDHYAAIFSTKAHEIADRLSNWAIRERVFSLEHDWRGNRVENEAGPMASVVMDREDLRTLVGTMGRFPWFRRTGWRILASARLVS